jgi:hypothetical protein
MVIPPRLLIQGFIIDSDEIAGASYGKSAC